MAPDIIAMGEPMLEFNAAEPGSLRAVRSYEVGWGGDTSNFVVAASRLGGRVGMITRLGADEFGQVFLDLWRDEGVDASQVIVEPGAHTGIYFVSRRGTAHTFTYYRKDSAASHLAGQDLSRDYIAGAKVFHTSGITQAISNSACDAVFHAIEIARAAGVLVSYDPNVRLKLWEQGRARAIILETAGMADFVFPSLEDAQFITGLQDPQAIASQLLERGPRVVALKLGGEGVLLATAEGMQRIAPVAVEVVDSTGAGDTFDGAFVVAYLHGRSYLECARFANVAAALTTTGWGAVKPIPHQKEVEALLAHNAFSESGS
ncbi:MAG: sugar kinase [Chloroflexi bacterium]|nr:sugar kinase [Chloroflexota bacterium]